MLKVVEPLPFAVVCSPSRNCPLFPTTKQYILRREARSAERRPQTLRLFFKCPRKKARRRRKFFLGVLILKRILTFFKKIINFLTKNIINFFPVTIFFQKNFRFFFSTKNHRIFLTKKSV